MSAMQLWRTLTHLFHPQRSNNHRARVLHPEAIAYLCVLAFGFAALVHSLPTIWGNRGVILGYASNISIEQVVEQTNQERARSGLSPLTLNSQLSQAALAKGQDMFHSQYWSHTSPSGTEPWSFISASGYVYRVAGENLARDFMNTSDMVSAWMASPTHRANIMNGTYQDIGVAVIDGTLQGVETTLVVQMFGTPRTGAPSTTQVAAATEQSLTLPQLQASQNPILPSPVPAESSAEEVENQADPSIATPSALFTADTEIQQAPEEPATVLAGVVVPAGVLESPLVSPIQLMKAFFLAVVLLLLATLAYDLLVTESRSTVRLAGKNMAHIILFSMVAFLIIFFRGGVVG